jgi:hypothetical protein
MQNPDKIRTFTGWAIVLFYAFVLAIFEGYGCYTTDSDHNLTNRDWFFQIWLGGVLVLGVVFASVPAFFILHERKRFFILALSLIGVRACFVVADLSYFNWTSLFLRSSSALE